jgi:hypothetical protein
VIAPNLRVAICAEVSEGKALLPLLAAHGITPTDARDDVEFRNAYNEAKREQVAQRKRA